MKNEEEIFLINNNPNKNILNSLISFNSYTSNDFKKINSSNNIINTSGSQPIVIFKKISKSLTQTFPNYKSNQPLKNNYISDGGLKKKINKYKSFISNPNQQNPMNTHLSKNNKYAKGPKTMRNINKRLIISKKEKLTKSKEKTQIIDHNNNKKNEKKKFSKKKIEKLTKKDFDKIKEEYHCKESHSQGHFNRKNKIFSNNYISKSICGINYNTSNNYHKNEKKIKNNNNANIKISYSPNNHNINYKNNYSSSNNYKKKEAKIKKDIKIKKEKKDKKIEESEKKLDQEQRKIEYIDALVKNGVLNVTKELNVVKKLTPKEILNQKKKDFLQENGITEIIINTKEKQNKNQPEININNLNIKSIRKKKISTKTSNYIKNKVEKLNISKSNSRYISFLNNNTNMNMTNTNANLITNIQETQTSNKNFKKKMALKPQINQFEYINKIQQEQRKLIGHKKEYTSRGLEKFLNINDFEPKLSDSFRHTNTNINSKTNINIDINQNSKINNNNINRKRVQYNHIKRENRQKLIEEMGEDEFPFSHRKSYRSPQEIYRYLKEKRIETKKEEENTEKEKQLKAYMTFQNLMNIGKKFDNNITKISQQIIPTKNRKEAKGHMKLRKEPNEYYVGTESSKNSSTFIDKKEYYISILESQKFVNKSKIGLQEGEKDKEIENVDNDNKEKKNDKKNKNVRKKLTRGFSTELFENKKIIDELYITINKANKIFSKENFNKIKNDLLKLNTDVNSTNKDNKKITITEEKTDNKEENNLNKNIKNNINNKIIKTPEIKIDIPNTTHSVNNIYNNININSNEVKVNNQKNSLSYYNTNYNSNLSGLNSQDKFYQHLSHTYSNSLNPIKKIKDKFESKTILNLIEKIKIVLKRKVFTFLYKMYLDKYTRKTYTMAFNCIVIVCKIYPFKKIEKYARFLEYYEAFKELFKPFIRNKFKKFLNNCFEIKIRKFILILELFYKYKAMSKLFIYCERDFKKEIINFLIITIKKPFYSIFLNKLISFKKRVDTNEINLPLNIPLLNDLIQENIIDNKENYPHNQNDNKIFEEINDEVNNIFNISNDYYSLCHQSKNIHSIKHIKNNQQKEINTHVNIKIKDLLNTENKDYLKKLSKIKDIDKFSDEVTNIIIEKILNTEIKPFSLYEKLIPYKSFKYDIVPKSQNTSLNNSYISSSCASLDQLSINNNNYFNDPRIQSLNESLISQMSYNSEFNKTIKDKKREQSMSIYVQKIGPKLIELICNEIKNNYSRIYNNISTPLRTDFEEVIIALELKDNEQLKKNYRILQVKEELKDIINREKIINKFGIVNKRIRKKYNQKIDESYDIFLNLSVIDTAIELINKERIYGEIGEPFSIYSLRNREISFKYNKNEPKKLVSLIYKSLMEYINNPIFLIKDSVINADEKKIIKCFKKDLEENECQWEDMEIVETQSKLEVTELILDQLYNEVIEILEHVQLSRKRGDLYQEKSIYACEDIPKLSFQQTTTENELIQDAEGREIIGP